MLAPNGLIKADIDTKKMIHIFIRLLKTDHGGSETVRSTSDRSPAFSRSTSWLVLDSFSLIASPLSSLDVSFAVAMLET
jgi:hypothetical protein